MDIRPVPPSERTLAGRDFFLLWAGVAISLAEIWAGGFLAPMGFWTGLWAILLGHLIGNTLMALGGAIGSDHGIMSMVSVRPAFGIRGSNLAAVLNIVQLIGWAAIMLIIGGRAGAALGKPVGGILASDAFWIIAIGAGTLLWALWTGKTAWKVLQNVSVDVEPKALFQRLTGRRSCPKCSNVFNVYSSPSKLGDQCDNHPGERAPQLVQRADDREDVIENRLKVYASQRSRWSSTTRRVACSRS